MQLYKALQILGGGGGNLFHGVLSSWILSSLRPTSKSKLAKMNWTTFCEILLACCDFWVFSVAMLKTSGDSLNFCCLKTESLHGWFWSSAWPWEQHQPQDFPVCQCWTLPLGAQASIFMLLRTTENHSHWVKFSQIVKALNLQKAYFWAAQARSQKALERTTACFLSPLRRCITSPVCPISSH